MGQRFEAMTKGSLCMTKKSKALMLALAVLILVFSMLAVKGAHRFLSTGAVIPVLLVAVIAEQIRRRGAVRMQTSRALSVVQVSGFVLSVAMLIAAGTLRQ
jgi:hypothetical protein